MSDRYKGAILSPTAPTVTPQSAGGIYTSSQQLQYQGQGVWPQAVNNPLTNSLRFRRSASAYLNRTPASAGNRQIWTWSGWVKLGSLSVSRQFFGTTGGATQDAILFNADNQLVVFSENASQTLLRTAQLFRDPSAWYHIVVAVDTTQATASNRVKIYVNGVQVTAFEYTQYPSQNFQGSINNNVIHYISTYDGSNWAFDGYLAEVNFVNAVQLTPSSFGTTDAYGIWQPIPYTGSYGTNGFYLPFTDNSALTTSSNVGLGKDFSGNGNYWITNNISITAGSTYDSMKDVPTNTNSNTANYATFNGIGVYTNTTSNLTYSNGNLQVTYNSADVQIGSSIRIPNISGKFYLEFTATYSSSSNGFVGLFIPNGSVILQQNGVIGNFGVCTIVSTTGVGYSSGQTISFAIDADTKIATIRINNTVNTVIDFAAIPTGVFIDPAVWLRQSGDSFIANYGQRPFAYTPPTGFVGLNTYNLPTPTILAGNQHFNAVLRNGYGSSGGTLDCGFQPDWVWEKTRNAASSHTVWDSVRGLPNALRPNETTAELSQNWLTGFVSNGLTFGTNDYGTGTTLVEWVWKANQGNNISNTQGTITSTVSANTTSGFSIVTYTGNATSGATVGHGLGVAPSMVILKSRSLATNWYVYHSGLTSASYQVYLNLTAAQDNSVTTAFNSVAPGATTFTLPGTGFGSNNSGATYVAYCFSAVAGYSAFGSYTGNGSTDGPFVYLGFRPRFVMIKISSGGTGNWEIFDTSRNTYNQMDLLLLPSSSAAESNAYGSYYIDAVSNGFKVRGSGLGFNGSGETLIYACFAENPFKIARGR